jgi:cytochrome c-type biogenesis protein CcmH
MRIARASTIVTAPKSRRVKTQVLGFAHDDSNHFLLPMKRSHCEEPRDEEPASSLIAAMPEALQHSGGWGLKNSLPRLAILTFALLLAASYAAATTRVSVDTVAEGLTCQCGCGLTVANCNHPQCEFSVPVRTQIESMINRGMSRAQIIGVFRTKYGEKILSAPTTEGFNLLAWIMPFAMIAAGAALLFKIAGRWRADSNHPGNDDSANGSGFDPGLRSELEAELKEQT